jgi:hypothetical protein
MWQHVPAHYTKPAPQWPLPRITRREREIWAREWTRGQAHMWEALDWTVQVALYVRQMVRAEQSKASESSRTTVLRMEDALGISYAGLARNRWILAAERRTATTSDEPDPTPVRQVLAGPTAKDRLRKRGMGIVEGGG